MNSLSAVHTVGFAIATCVSLAACAQHTSNPSDSGGTLIPEQAAFDVTYYELWLDVDPGARSIEGRLAMEADIVQRADTVVLDLESKLDVSGVRFADGSEAAFERRGGQIWIALPGEHAAGDRIGIEVAYGGKPHVAKRAPWDGGFTWSKTPSGVHWIATTCQKEGADVWWPVKDHPSDEPDSMRMHFTLPKPLAAASNGRLESVDDRGARSTYNWFVSTPINTYNIALNAADYEVISRRIESVAGDSIDVQFYVLPEDYERGVAFFPEIVEHLQWFESKIGPYPFRADKYGVVQTPHLGMEHQTIIAYGANFDNGAMTGGIDWGFDALHHHELAHEWWGNLVTNADWSDMWLHEGFGSYMQALYVEDKFGKERYHEYMNNSRRGISNRIALAPRESLSADEIYGGDIYVKGAWVLHTLRYTIGDQEFFEALRQMAFPTEELAAATDGRQCRFVDTQDFQDIVESITRRDMDWFFEVYVRQPKLPVLHTVRSEGQVELHWDVPEGLTFDMPVLLREGDIEEYLRLGTEPTVVRYDGDSLAVDPEGWILKKVDGIDD